MNLALLEKVLVKYLESHPDVVEKLLEAVLHKFMGKFLDSVTVQ